MPSKIQTRRTVSFRAEVYVRIVRAAEVHGLAAAALVESAVTSYLDMLGVEKVSRDEALVSLGVKRQTCEAEVPDKCQDGRPRTRLARCTEVAG